MFPIQSFYYHTVSTHYGSQVIVRVFCSRPVFYILLALQDRCVSASLCLSSSHPSIVLMCPSEDHAPQNPFISPSPYFHFLHFLTFPIIPFTCLTPPICLVIFYACFLL